MTRPDNRIIIRTARALAALALAAALSLSCGPRKSDMDKYIDGLMARMTTEQKIGQLNIHAAPGILSTPKISEQDVLVQMLRAGYLGGVYGVTDMQAMKDLQAIALESGAGIPLVFGLDALHGHETILPVPLAMASTWDPGLVEKGARMAAREASASGIGWVFGPAVDIARDPRWGGIVEGAGEDPYLGARMAEAYVRGYQGGDGGSFAADGVMACVKHYALGGAVSAGRDYNPVFMDRQEAFNGFLGPYKAAADAGAGSFMTSYSEFEGVPATMNSYLVDEVLRGRWGFAGMVVSDASAIQEQMVHGVGTLQEVSASSLAAGVDMDMDSDAYVRTLQKSLSEGGTTQAEIDKACRRVLEAKYKLGLFEDPYRHLDPSRSATDVYTEENKALAKSIAQDCQVLLKNEGVLPLDPGKRIAVIGPLGDDPAAMAGCWSVSSHTGECTTILEGLRKAGAGSVSYARGSNLFNDPDTEEQVLYGPLKAANPDMVTPPVHIRSNAELLSEALALARRSDIVLACVGEVPSLSGEGASRSDITIPDAQRDLLKALAATGKPVVLVLTTGRPLVLDWEQFHLDAILLTWQLGTTAGDAIADVLLGKVNPSGRLTATFPLSAGQVPLFYNHKRTGRPLKELAPFRRFTSGYSDIINAPLYPFGYGLSYSKVSYGVPMLSSTFLAPGDSVQVKIPVTNMGPMDVRETVQLYIHAKTSSSTRPVKELRAFQKVDIPPKMTRGVVFDIRTDDLAYYDHDLRWVCEGGEYEIHVGPNSAQTKAAVLQVYSENPR